MFMQHARGRLEIHTKFLVGKREDKSTTGRSRLKWEDNLKKKYDVTI